MSFAASPADATPAAIAAALLARLAAGTAPPATLDELRALGVPAGVLMALAGFVDEMDEFALGASDESDVVAMFVALLVRSPAGDALPAGERRQLGGGVLGDRRLRVLRAALAPAFAGVTADAWAAEEELFLP